MTASDGHTWLPQNKEAARRKLGGRLRFTPKGGQGLTQFRQPLAVTSRSRRD
jgi:hypothetical protein